MGNQIDSTGPPVFNGKYTIKSQIGEGKTAMVYLADSIEDPTQQVAIKILKKTLKQKTKKSAFVCNCTSTSTDFMFSRKEMEIHSKLDHKTIVKVIECGENGKITKSPGNTIDGLYFMIMEYVPAGIMFDIIEQFSGVGEIIAKFFMNQLLDSAEYLKEQNIAHLDLKLENILVDKDMNVKITDFGFSSYQDKRL